MGWIRKILLTGFAILFIAFFSCEHQKWFNIPNEIQNYVTEFDNYGKQYGYNFDFEATGLVIEFNDLEGNTAGICYHEDPVRIHIDKSQWESSNDDNRRAIVFHELAHGFLNRTAINDTLKNGEWRSLMAETNDNYFSSINFSGLRKEYYIEELFVASRQEEVINEPEWTSHELDYNVIKKHNKQYIFIDYFDDNNQAWKLIEDQENTVGIDNGVLTISGNSEKDIAYWKESSIDNTLDFEIEVKLKISSNNPNDICGLLWSGNGENNAYLLAFNTNHNILVYNTALNYIYFYRYSQPTFNTTGFNKFTIRKLNGLYYFYLNEEFLYYTDVHEELGNIMGFFVGKNTEIQIDELYITQINTKIFKSNIGSGNSYLKLIKEIQLPGIRDVSE